MITLADGSRSWSSVSGMSAVVCMYIRPILVRSSHFTDKTAEDIWTKLGLGICGDSYFSITSTSASLKLPQHTDLSNSLTLK